MMDNNPKPNDIYRHFKGSLYKIITVAIHSETGEQMAVYQALYGNCQVYVRPLTMFLERVDREKYPDAGQEYRFERMSQLIEVGKKQGETTAAEEEPEEIMEEPLEEEPVADRRLMQFLDAETYEDKLGILGLIHPGITDELINTMAMAIDVEVGQGDIETRYQELKSCLLMLDKFECNRIR